MGRRKIEMKAIEGKKNRIDTFHKRKVGLVKKAAELSMLCGIKMLLAFEDLNGDVFKYSTHGIFEPREYFRESWTSYSATAKTADDYPDFFARLYKKRKPAESSESNRTGGDTIDQEQEKSDDDDDGISIDENSPNEPNEELEIQNGQHLEKPLRRNGSTEENSVLEIVEDFGRRLSLLTLPGNEIYASEAKMLLNTVSDTIEKFRRPQHKTTLLEKPFTRQMMQGGNRRRTVGPANDLSNRTNASFMAQGNNSFAKLPTLDLDHTDRRNSMFAPMGIGSIIFEEPEFKERFSMSPINKTPKDNNGGFGERHSGQRPPELNREFISAPAFPNFMPRYQNYQMEYADPRLLTIRNSFSIVPETTKMFSTPLSFDPHLRTPTFEPTHLRSPSFEQPQLQRFASFGIPSTAAQSRPTYYGNQDVSRDFNQESTDVTQFVNSEAPQRSQFANQVEEQFTQPEPQRNPQFVTPEQQRNSSTPFNGALEQTPRSLVFNPNMNNISLDFRQLRSNERHNSFGTLLNVSKLDSPHQNPQSQQSQLEISKNNTKEAWFSLSKLDNSVLDQSIISKENPNTMGDMANQPRSNSRLGISGVGSNEENSGLMLFSPFPMTSMTAFSKADNFDWVAYSLKTQQEQQNRTTSFVEPNNYSFQSNTSIMKSPRLEKQIKFNRSFYD